MGDNNVNNQSAVPMLLSMPGNANALGRLCFKFSQAKAKTNSRAEKTVERSAIMKSPSLVDWYHILRAHHQWTVFQAIRYALWLAR